MRLTGETSAWLFEEVCWPQDSNRLREKLAGLFPTFPATISLTFDDVLGRRFVLKNLHLIEDLEGGVRQIEENLECHRPLTIRAELNRPRASQGDNAQDWRAFQRDEDVRVGVRPAHLFQFTPMFFRRTGSAVDLVNLYASREVFLVCNGLSFAAIEQSALTQPGIVTFGMNNGAHGFRPNLWTALDEPARFMASIWRDPRITKFVPLSHLEKPIWDHELNSYSQMLAGDSPNVFGIRRNDDFDPDNWLEQPTVNCGHQPYFGGVRSTMLFALRICHLLGFKTVYLVGCDFAMEQSRPYWFAERCPDSFVEHNNTAYERLQQLLALLKPTFDAAGFAVFNTNPSSRLTVFPYRALEEAIRRNRLDIQSASTEGMYCRSMDGSRNAS